MSFDFAKAHEDAKKDLTNKNLFLILLGSSGNGKSYTQGTFGVKTLYLYTQGESHGPKSAATTGVDNITPVCIDREGEKELSADDAIARLFSILDDIEGIKKAKFKAISIDGASEIETLIRSTATFKKACLTDKGIHNAFAEGPATLSVFRQLISKLKRLQRELDIHVCLTAILNVKEYGDNGAIVDSTPQLHGYNVATGLVQQFDDVMMIGRMQKDDKVAYRFQLLASANKSTTDKSGAVRKTYNFSPRLTGTDITSLGATLKADLGELIKLKSGGK